MKKAYFSNRIYKSTLDSKDVSFVEHALFVFNQAKHFAASMEVKEKRSGLKKRYDSVHLTVKAKYDLDDYYTNSAVQAAKAANKSQEELKKLYIQNKEEKINSIKTKIKTTKARLTVVNKIKKSIVRTGNPVFNKTSREQKKGNYFVVEYKNKTDIYYHVYSFEHEYLDNEIKFLKSQIGKFEFKLDRTLKQLNSIKTGVKNIVFGSKKLFNAQHTVYQGQKDIWKDKWVQSRYSSMTISGRKDAKFGNFVFSYNPDSKVFTFDTPNKKGIQIHNASFPYGQDKVNNAIHQQLHCKNKKEFGKPIGWSVEDHKNYFIFKCLIEEDENPYKNFSKTDGVIGIDCNCDHFAVSNINGIGQLVDSFVQKFSLNGKSSNQITKIIEAEAVSIIEYAVKNNKPIVLERLDTTKSKAGNPYGNKKANRHMSMFAYEKMLSSLKNRAEKCGVSVFEVNPTYTSQIGKIKYMKKLGITIHQAAAYVIARRAMGFKETLPPVLNSLRPEKIAGLHHWVQWKWVSSFLKGVHPRAFYASELFDLSMFLATQELFRTGALTDLEKTSVDKLLKQ